MANKYQMVRTTSGNHMAKLIGVPASLAIALWLNNSEKSSKFAKSQNSSRPPHFDLKYGEKKNTHVVRKHMRIDIKYNA